MQILTRRWTELKYHRIQQQYWSSQKRFNIAHSGRRSGKTEIAKRRGIRKALLLPYEDGRIVASAPTHRQAIEIFWDDLIALVPKWALRDTSTSFRTITLKSGVKIEVFGMDKAERIEGPPLDHFIGDEIGNYKPKVWQENIRPALSTAGRPGSADLIGVPEGKNHYFDLTEDAKKPENVKDWSVFCWPTSDINPTDAEQAKKELDSLVHEQEYEGAFVSFGGLTYYAFNGELNCPPDGERMMYNSNYPLIFCHDFNRIPTNCIICQEQDPPSWLIARNGGQNRGKVTVVIDEVFLKSDGNTEKLCDILISRWKDIHKGKVILYGDAAGGAKTSQGVAGSDWDIIETKLSPVFSIYKYVPKSNPFVRARINAVNSRLRSADGYINVIIDKIAAPMLIRDFQSVTCNERGEIEKDQGLLTHVSDGFGYYIAEEFPISGKSGKTISV